VVDGASTTIEDQTDVPPPATLTPDPVRSPTPVSRAPARPTAAPAPAASVVPAAEPEPVDPWDFEAAIIDDMLANARWHIRAFVLLRLARYEHGDAVARLTAALQDPQWQVRLLALLESQRRGAPIPREFISSEQQPEVIRALLVHRLPAKPATIQAVIRRLGKSRNLDHQLLALEILILSGIDKRLTKSAAETLGRAIKDMKREDLALHAWPLSRLLGRTPTSLASGWITVTTVLGTGRPVLLDQRRLIAHYGSWSKPTIADLDVDAFDRVVDYLDQLAHRELDLAILIDATGSMGGEIDACQVQVDLLIRLMSQLSKSMRVGFCAYRDHGDAEIVAVSPLSNDTLAVRRFLQSVIATGGGDYPESLLSGLNALA
jgi:hypothetical protein